MKHILKQWLCLALSLSFTFHTPAVPAAEATGARVEPQPQLADGGGKKPPPNLPPVKDFDGNIPEGDKGGGGKGGGTGGGNGGDFSADSGGDSGRIRVKGVKGPKGQDVFYVGVETDAGGRRTVWAFTIAESGRVVKMLGYLNKDGKTVEWRNPQDMPRLDFAETGKVELPTDKQLEIRNMATQPPDTPFKGDSGPRGEKAYYTGKRDIFGREMVWYSGANGAKVYGYVEPGNFIQWLSTPTAPETPKEQINKDKIVDGVKGPHGEKVYFVGRKDIYGREIVKFTRGIFGGRTITYGYMNLSTKTVVWTAPQNYPALPPPKEPIAKNKSLVPVQSSGSGTNESTRSAQLVKGSNSYLEKIKSQGGLHSGEAAYLNSEPPKPQLSNPPKLDASTSAERPSNLHNMLGGWPKEKVEQVAKLIRRTKSKLRRMKRGWQQYKQAGAQSQTGVEFIPSQQEISKIQKADKAGEISKPAKSANVASEMARADNLEIGRSSGIFYFALGMAAAFNLMMNYPDDPLAWEHYIGTLTDPVGYLMLAGFFATAGWIYKILPSKTFKGRLGAFSLAMLAGSLASDAIGDFARDPDTLRCLGFSAWGINNVAKGINFATSGLKEKYKWERDIFSCDKAHEKWSSVSRYADALYPSVVGFMSATGIYVGAVTAINYASGAKMIRAFKVPKVPAGGWVSVAVTAGQFVLFFAADWVANGLMGIEQKMKEIRAAEFKFSSDELGKETVSSVETELYKNWSVLKAMNYQGDELVDKVSLLIERYGQMHNEWRTLQLMPAFDGYRNWIGKVIDFNSMLTYSYDIYKNVYEYNKTLGSHIVEQGDLLGFINQERKDPNIIPPKFSYSLNDWSGIIVQKPIDYILLSMACGPNAQAEPEGWSVGSFLLGLIGMNNKEDMLSDPWGSSARFHPPRLINRDTPVICDQFPKSEQLKPCGKGSCVKHYNVTQMPINTPEGDKVIGIENYLQRNLRKDIPDFPTWWQLFVRSPTGRMQLEFQSQFHGMMIDKFLPPIKDQSYFRGWMWNSSLNWCTRNQEFANTGLMKDYDGNTYMKYFIADGEKLDCDVENSHRLANGVANDLKDELRLYLAMLTQLLNNQGEAIAGYTLAAEEMTAQVLEPAMGLLGAVDMMKDIVDSEGKDDPSLDTLAAALVLPIGVLSAHLKREDHWVEPIQKFVPYPLKGPKLIYNNLLAAIYVTANEVYDYASMMAKIDPAFLKNSEGKKALDEEKAKQENNQQSEEQNSEQGPNSNSPVEEEAPENTIDLFPDMGAVEFSRPLGPMAGIV